MTPLATRTDPTRTRYRRSHNGSVAHHADCPTQKRTRLWLYPDLFGLNTDAELFSDITVRAPWVRFCRRCFG